MCNRRYTSTVVQFPKKALENIMTLSDFSYLKEQVVRTVVSSDNHSNHLRSVKDLFKQDINSIRRFEKISSIGQLLNILELRGLLSDDNVEPLKVIARKINSSELMSKINEFEESHVPREYGNYYVPEKGNKTFLTESINRTSPLESNVSKRKKDRIVKTVVEEIGSYWRNLARSLKIRECMIDDIDYNNQTLRTKAMKMMEQFEERCDPQKWFFVLCDSLDTIHRRELARKLQEIMMMNI